MAVLHLLAIVLGELPIRLQTARINFGIVQEVRRSRHHGVAGQTVAAYDEKMFACEDVKSRDRFIIQGKHKPFVDYYYERVHSFSENLFPTTVNCKTYMPPQKPSSMLRNLITHALPEDVIGLIGSHLHDVHCDCISFRSINMTLLQKCSAAAAEGQLTRFNRKVGGLCTPIELSAEEQTLQTCMTYPLENQVALCRVESHEHSGLIIEDEEKLIKDNEDMIQADLKLIKDIQERIKKKQAIINDSQDIIDMRKQNIVYVKQIFEGT